MALRQNYLQQEEQKVNRIQSLPSIQTILTEPTKQGPRLSQSLPTFNSTDSVSSPNSINSDIDLRSPTEERWSDYRYGPRSSYQPEYDISHRYAHLEQYSPVEQYDFRADLINRSKQDKENQLLSFANIVSNQAKSPTLNPMSLSAMTLDSNVE
jgi:hypothetical protein